MSHIKQKYFYAIVDYKTGKLVPSSGDKVPVFWSKKTAKLITDIFGDCRMKKINVQELHKLLK